MAEQNLDMKAVVIDIRECTVKQGTFSDEDINILKEIFNNHSKSGVDQLLENNAENRLS